MHSRRTRQRRAGRRAFSTGPRRRSARFSFTAIAGLALVTILAAGSFGSMAQAANAEPLHPATGSGNAETTAPGAEGAAEATPSPTPSGKQTGSDTPVPADAPAPPPGYALLSVKVGGDRITPSPASKANVNTTPVAGVTLRFSNDYKTPDAFAGSAWATCVSDAQGDCNFYIPAGTTIASSTSGLVRQIGAPAGYQLLTKTPTGGVQIGAAGSYSFYVTRPGTGAMVFSSGQTYYSTSFYPSSLTANGVFMKTDTDANLQAGGNSTPRIGSSFGVWAAPRNNPALKSSCGLKIALALDVSTSQSSSMTNVRNSAKAFTNALVGTPSTLTVIPYATTVPASGSGNGVFTSDVRTSAQATALNTKINGISVPTGSSQAYTNIDGLFRYVDTNLSDYDVVLIVTDGSPNLFQDVVDSGTIGSTWGTPSARGAEAAIFSANAVKANGTAILPLYVNGNAPGDTAAATLQAFSGPGATRLVKDYSAMATDLAAFAKGNCDTSVQLEKRVVNAGYDVTGKTDAQLRANSTPAQGFVFDAGAGAGATINPASTTVTTGADGKASIGVTIVKPATSGAVGVRERQQAGYTIVPVSGKNASCTVANTGAAIGVTNADPPMLDTNPGFMVTGVTTDSAVDCTVYNQRIAVPDTTVTLTKQVADKDGRNPAPAAGWTLGADTVAKTGTVTAAPGAKTQVTDSAGQAKWKLGYAAAADLANVTVSETQQAGYAFASGTCTVTPATGSPSTVTIPNDKGLTLTDVAPGSAVACTIVNKQIAGTIAWQKVGEDGQKLSGSEWKLQGPDAGGPTVTVRDCTAAPCVAGDLDTDPVAGSIKIGDLSWGTYTLTETKAPAGYQLDSTPRTVKIGAPAAGVQLDWSLGAITNKQQLVPAIPLTGGVGRDDVLIAGGILAAAAAGGFAAWAVRRSKRRTATD